MNSENPSILVPEAMGTPFEGGFYGGNIRIGSHLYAIAWAPKALGETKKAWLPSREQVPNATSFCDSMANTLAMANAGSPLAQWARGLDIGGHTDWCVPARDVLELGYRHLKPTNHETCCSWRDGENPSSVPFGYPYTEANPIVQTTVEAFKAGGAEAFEPAWYLASTQFSESYAWFQDFYHGYQYNHGKSFEARCRAVRMIQIGS